MAMDKSAGGVTVIYKCPKCGVYFQAYSKAFRHLKVKHDFKVKSVESVTFQRCSIPIERLKKDNHNHDHLSLSSSSSSNKGEGTSKDVAYPPKELKKITNGNGTNNRNKAHNNAAVKKPEGGREVGDKDNNYYCPSSSASASSEDDVMDPELPDRLKKSRALPPRKEGGRVEIKLDDLKASEIETLMEDLFQTGSGTRTRPRRTRNPVLKIPSEEEEDNYIVEEGPLSPSSSSTSSLLEVTTKKSKRARKKTKVVANTNTLKASEIETLMKDLFKTRISRTRRNKRNVILSEDHRCDDEDLEEEGPSMSKSPPITPPSSSNKRRKRKRFTSSNSEDSDYQIEGGTHKSRSEEEQESYSDEAEEGPGDPATTTTIRIRKPRPAKEPNQFQCRICPETFDTESIFLEHMGTTHLHNGVYTCPKEGCGRTFDNLRGFHIHCHYHVPRRNNENEPNKTPKKNNRKREQSEYKFHCPKCAKPCRDITHLKRHQGVHEQKQRQQRRPGKPKPRKQRLLGLPGKVYPFSCPLCESKYEFLTRLREHFIIHLENNPFVCKMSGCGYRFSNRKSFKSHVDLHIGKRHFKCDQCEFAFARRTSLACHVKHYHGKGGRNKHVPENQTFHVQPVEVEVDFPEGDKSTSVKQPNNKGTENEDGAIRVKDEEDLWRIEVGSQHFDDTPTPITSSSSKTSESENDTGSNLPDNEEQDHEILAEMASSEYFSNISLRSITLKDPVFLKLLEENPQAAEQVITKKDRVCNLDPEILKCPVCGWEAIRRFNLDMHIKRFHNQDGTQSIVGSTPTATSTGSLPSDPSSSATVTLLCSQCGYPSTSSDDLAKHMSKEHSRRGNHGCKYCGRYFKDTETLKGHEKRVHFSEKKYSCPECPVKYATRATLDHHLSTKHSTTGSICTTCKKKFPNPSELRAHRKTHSKRDRVTCKFCGVSSVDKYSLERHIRIVHLGVKAKDLGRKTQVIGEHSNPTRTPPIPIPTPHQQEEGGNNKEQDQHQDGDSEQILGL